jgi:hypothetical protein
MLNNQNQQKKVLTMLTEIYDQLEELEAVLECSLSDLRGDLHKEHSKRVEACELELNQIEQTYNDTEIVHDHQNGKIKIQQVSQNLKLELGF